VEFRESAHRAARGSDRPGKVASPTLIVWGDRDALCPRHDQHVLLAGIPGARLVVYAGAGHALHWEEPERFAADVAAFAESPGRVPAP
jgi:non-heme chloroperoxidase